MTNIPSDRGTRTRTRSERLGARPVATAEPPAGPNGATVSVTQARVAGALGAGVALAVSEIVTGLASRNQSLVGSVGDAVHPRVGRRRGPHGHQRAGHGRQAVADHRHRGRLAAGRRARWAPPACERRWVAMVGLRRLRRGRHRGQRPRPAGLDRAWPWWPPCWPWPPGWAPCSACSTWARTGHLLPDRSTAGGQPVHPAGGGPPHRRAPPPGAPSWAGPGRPAPSR